MHRQPELLAQIVREALHLLRLRPFRPAHAQRITHHDLRNLVLANQLTQPLEINPLVLALQRLLPLRRDSEQIRNRNPDPLRSNIEPQNSPAKLRRRHVRCHLVHAAIICPAQSQNFG